MVNFLIIYINYVLGTAIEVLKCKLIYDTNKFVFFFFKFRMTLGVCLMHTVHKRDG